MGKFGIRKEAEVGILWRVAEEGGLLRAVVKERFSDFHVNEIDREGKIVRLTSMEVPAVVEEDCSKEVEGLLSPGEISAVKALREGGGGRGKEALLNVTKLGKEERTKVHRWVKGAFDSKLSSETLDKEGEKLIRVVEAKGNSRRDYRRPANRARYTHCVLYKEGVDTPEAVSFLAKKLNLKPGLITYAGIKDKRAKTTQRIAVSNMEPSRLLGICKYSRNIKVGNFSYDPKPLSLGELKGNHFKLLLKDLKLEDGSDQSLDAVINKRVESLKANGFINYYGLQRFGSYVVSTWEIGKEFLKQNWLQGFDLILQVKDNDPPWMRQAKELWLKDRNAEEAIKQIPSSFRSIETHLLHGLAKFYRLNDFVNVFTKMPRSQRLLYVHAYQSYLWNKVASYRFKEFGMSPVVGDLVYENDSNICDEDETEIESLQHDVSGRNRETLKSEVKVKCLTQEDITSGKYNIYQVLIPLFGINSKSSENKVNDFFESVLKDEGIGIECFHQFKPIADRPTGAYRRLMVLPSNVTHQVKAYADGDSLDNFIPSELDILQGTSTDNGSTSTAQSDSLVEDHDKKKCLIIEFSLPSSSYATMALREILSEPESETDTDAKSDDCIDGEVTKEENDEPVLKKVKTS